MRRHRSVRNVLIVQPTITHYRVPFFNALERLRPNTWQFAVTFDPSEFETPRFLQAPLAPDALHFPTVPVRHIELLGHGRKPTYQTIWRRAGGFDLIIVEQALHDLAYLLCQVHRLHGTRFAYWGDGRDRLVERATGLKRLAEGVKLALTRHADGLFAYTPGVKAEMVRQGVAADRVFALSNTIDIDEQRAAFERHRPLREEIRRALGVEGKKVLLFVGRFTRNKRVPFLIEAFSALHRMSPDTHLLLVGGGADVGGQGMPGVTFLGSTEDLDRIARAYVASDVFAFPGTVGLAPLQAMCYDLPAVTIDSLSHGAELEYLTPANSLILPARATAEGYAAALRDLLADADRVAALRAGIWPSIRHLTIDNMALNFIRGVNALLAPAAS